MSKRVEDFHHHSNTCAGRNERVLTALWRNAVLTPLDIQPHFSFYDPTVRNVEPDVTHQTSSAERPRKPNGAECRGDSFVAIYLVYSYRSSLDARLCYMREQDSDLLSS